jgi:hypothetical protein
VNIEAVIVLNIDENAETCSRIYKINVFLLQEFVPFAELPDTISVHGKNT